MEESIQDNQKEDKEQINSEVEEITNKSNSKTTEQKVSALEKISFGVFVGLIAGFIFGTKIIDVFGLNIEGLYEIVTGILLFIFLITIIGYFWWKMSFKPFVGLLIGLFIGSIMIELLTKYFVTRLEIVALLFIVIVFILLGSGYFIYVYKNQILEKLFGTAKIKTREIRGTFFGIVKAGFSRNFEEASNLTDTIFEQVRGWIAWRGYTRFLFLLLQTLFIIFGGLIGSLLLYQQNELLKVQNRYVEKQTDLIKRQNIRLDHQTYLQEAERRSSLVFLLGNIMDAVDAELKVKENKERSLSPQLIGQIISLSNRLKPYKYLDSVGDTLTGILSPERAQLLVSLIESQLDTNTYKKIYAKADFSYSEFYNDKLLNYYLKGANLSYSVFSEGDLMGANFEGANLNYTDFSSADLTGANLNYADFLGSDLSNAKLDFCSMMMTQFRKVDMSFVSFKDVKINNFFYDADLSFVDFSGKDLRGTNFKLSILFNAQFSCANVSKISFLDCELEQSNFSDANLEGTLFERSNLQFSDFTSAKTDSIRIWNSSLNLVKIDSESWIDSLKSDSKKFVEKRFYIRKLRDYQVEDLGNKDYRWEERPEREIFWEKMNIMKSSFSAGSGVSGGWFYEYYYLIYKSDEKEDSDEDLKLFEWETLYKSQN